MIKRNYFKVIDVTDANRRAAEDCVVDAR